MSDVIISAEEHDTRPSPKHLVNHVSTVLDLSTQHKHQRFATEETSRLLVISPDPRLWKRSDVVTWLLWAVKFYQLDDVDTSQFAMNGRGLCLLTRNGFMSRAPACGDVLHSDFQRRYAVEVLKTGKERRTRRKLYGLSDSAEGDPVKRPKTEET